MVSSDSLSESDRTSEKPGIPSKNITTKTDDSVSISVTDSTSDSKEAQGNIASIQSSSYSASSGKQISSPPRDKALDNSSSSSLSISSNINENFASKWNKPRSRSNSTKKDNNIEDIISPTITTNNGNPITGDDTSQQKNSISTFKSSNENVLQNEQNKHSLRRANIPPPLGLQQSGPTKANITGNNKINIPLKQAQRRFSTDSPIGNGTSNTSSAIRGSFGVTKPRVRYLGKTPKFPYPTNLGPYANMSQNQQLSLNAIMMMNEQHQQQIQQIQQQQQQHYMMMMQMYPQTVNPYMYNESMPIGPMGPMGPMVSMPPMATMPMVPPRSAILPSYPPQSYPYFKNLSTIDSSSSSLLNKAVGGSSTYATNDVQFPRQGIPVTNEPDHQHEVSNKSNKDGEDEEEEEEEEGADLAIESDALPTPIFTKPPQIPELLQGEIRILQNRFSFEFPKNEDGIERKMFLSICNKIWKESKELNKDHTIS